MLHVRDQFDIDNKLNLKNGAYLDDNYTMDVTESKPIIESKTSNLATTTVPVRYIVEDSEDTQTGGESCAEVETYQLNEIYSTDDDENKNYVFKSANSDFSASQQSADSTSESEISLCQLTNNDKVGDGVIEPKENVVFRGDKDYNGDSPLSNGVVLTPRYSVPTSTVPSFRLSIPSIEEVKESGSDCGEMDSPPSPSRSIHIQQNMNSKNLQVKNKASQERRSSFAGESQDQKQSRPLRRRFSISVSSSDDESSSSNSESEEQRKIEKYLQSRQRRRHSAATTSNELLQAMSVLMGSGRRGSGKGSSLFPLLANALANLANSGGLQNESANKDEPKKQRKSCPDAPIIRVSGDGECTCQCKASNRPVSPKDLLTRPYSPTGSDNLNDKKDCNGSPEQDSKQRLDAEIEVLRILTTRSPAVSENDDSDSDSHERPPRRRKSKNGRRSSLHVPEMTSSQARRSSVGATPLQTHHSHGSNKTKPSVLPSSSKSQSKGSSPASLTTQSQSRRSSLSITPPSSKTQSRRSSLKLSKQDSENTLADDLRQRLEKTSTHPPVTHGVTTVQPPTTQKTFSNNSLTPEPAGSRLPDRRASMCVPATHHFAANPPASKEEEEEIRFRATLRGRRRSSWAGAGAPPPLVAQIRATSPMTLLRESNYYGKLTHFFFNINVSVLFFTCPVGK